MLKGSHRCGRILIGRIGDWTDIIDPRTTDQRPRGRLSSAIPGIGLGIEGKGHPRQVSPTDLGSRVSADLSVGKIDLDAQAEAVLFHAQGPGLRSADQLIGVVVHEGPHILAETGLKSPLGYFLSEGSEIFTEAIKHGCIPGDHPRAFAIASGPESEPRHEAADFAIPSKALGILMLEVFHFGKPLLRFLLSVIGTAQILRAIFTLDVIFALLLDDLSESPIAIGMCLLLADHVEQRAGRLENFRVVVLGGLGTNRL